MRESRLTEDEYLECRDELDDLSRLIKFNIVIDVVKNKKTSNVAASKAGCSVNDIYDWYFKGREGDEVFKDFYEMFHSAYVRPNIVPLQKKLDSGNVSVDTLIRSNKHLFTKKDFDIWLKNGLINVGVLYLDDDNDDEDDDEKESKSDKKKVKEISLKKFNRMTNNRSSLGRITKNDYDVEELKRQLLKK